ncbi:MAG: sugar transferase [Actinobacteria bacterium]|nr:sugar transferase [Actinomycetota bacterium]
MPSIDLRSDEAMNRKNPDCSVTKRLVDIVISASLLILLAPLFVVISLVVKLMSEGPVFYRWKVVGRDNADFTSYKFRSMVEHADRIKQALAEHNEMNGPVFKMKNDPRITAVGSFLRKYSIDELPQLFSVLRGQMSLVGPRPPSRKEAEQFRPWQRRKLSIKPGITCLWQVGGRNKITDFDEWVKLDLEYIDNWSLKLDFEILFKTLVAVLKGTGQ